MTARGRHRGLRLVFGLLALALLAACRLRIPDAPMEADRVQAAIARLERQVARRPGDARASRDLAHLYWLHAGKTELALPLLDRLAAGGDPVARLSRALIARERLDAPRVWEHAGAILRDAAGPAGAGRDGRELRLLAPPAARLLEDVRRDRPADDRAFVELFDAVAPGLEQLGPETAEELLGTRAAIARRAGEDYRRWYDAQGCVREWVVGPVEGHLGELELELRDGDSNGFAVDAAARPAALSCVVRLWNQAPRAGIRRMRAVVETGDDGLRLELSAQWALRAYLDGRPLHRTDLIDRWPARETVLELDVTPGEHLLEVRTAIPEDRGWVLVRATTRSGRPLPTRAADTAAVGVPWPGWGAEAPRVASSPWPAATPSLAGGIHLPLRRWLAVEDALARGDVDQAEARAAPLRGHAPGFAEAALLLAQVEADDGSRGANASAVRRQRALEAGLARDPDLERARLLLLDHRLGQGDTAQVLEDLKALAGRLDTVDGQLLRWRAYLERGSEWLAERALARAVELEPDDCDVLAAQRRMAKGREQVALEDALTARMGHCPGMLELRARAAVERGDPATADALLARQLERVPDDLDALEARAAVAQVREDWPQAIGSLLRVLEYAPFRASARIALADTIARSGRPDLARAAAQEAIAAAPHSGRLREIGQTLGLPDPLLRWRADGRRALAEYLATPDPYEGVKEVLVLDRDVAEVYGNGGQRHIVHQIVHLKSKEALDTYGEITLPEEARILTLHSIKPDGTVLEPESVAGKDGLSLRDLAVGDFVEMEYVLESEPITALPGHVDLSRFRFQSVDVPYHWSELVVLAPHDLPVLVEARNGAPPVERSRDGDRQVLRFLATRMPRKGDEPHPRSMLDELPNVRVYSNLDVEAWLRSVAMQMRAAQRTNPELRRLVARLTRGLSGDRARVDALYRWVMDNVREDGDLTVHATRTLAAREGNRLMLLRAMVRHAGLRSQIWLARDAFGPRILEGGHPMVEAYQAPVLAVWIDDHETPLVLMTVAKAQPPGYLLPAYSGARALRLQLAPDEPPPGAVRLPENPERLADRRRYDLEFELDAQGAGTLRGTLELQGMEALLWRNLLESIDRDRREQSFQEGELSVIARGAGLDLVELQIENETELEAPLVLRFSARASGIGVRQGGDLVVPAALVAMNLAHGYTQLPERWSALAVPYAPVQEARVVVRVAGARLSPPDAVRVESRFGGYTRTVRADPADPSRLVLETRSTLATGIVPAGDYAELTELTRAIAAAERSVVRAR
jgi:tetratricopeptide (TPR) repeat protein